MSERVVIWSNGVSPLYLTCVTWKDGEVLEGDCENGNWFYRLRDGHHQALWGTGRRRVVHEWPVTSPTIVVDVTDCPYHADYNMVIAWATARKPS